MKWTLPPQIVAQWRDFRANRRLQLGALVILAILAAEGSLRWLAHMEAQETRLAALRDQKQRLQGQSRDQAALASQLEALERIVTTARARLWVVPSEAVGQARQKDWLQDMFRQTGVVPHSITLATPRAYSERASGAAPVAAGVPASGQPGDFREFRATLVFPFSPAGLEKTLAALEGGEPFIRVESLLASRRERRVELEISMLMEIDATTGAAIDTPTSGTTDAPTDATTAPRGVAPVAVERVGGAARPGVVDLDAVVQAVIARENAAAGARP